MYVMMMMMMKNRGQMFISDVNKNKLNVCRFLIYSETDVRLPSYMKNSTKFAFDNHVALISALCVRINLNEIFKRRNMEATFLSQCIPEGFLKN